MSITDLINETLFVLFQVCLIVTVMITLIVSLSL